MEDINLKDLVTQQTNKNLPMMHYDLTPSPKKQPFDLPLDNNDDDEEDKMEALLKDD
jgi:hypothetical protein